MELLTLRTRVSARRATLALLLAVAASACIGTSPETKARDDLGPDPGPYEDGPYHRAGFPCTVCHGESANPAFELAGTVYEDASGTLGVANATITVRDASGQQVTATSNRVGTFFFEVGSGGGRRGSEGRSVLTAKLAYPLSVSVSAGGQEQKMRGLIWREHSCAACHRGKPSMISNGPVFVGASTP